MFNVQLKLMFQNSKFGVDNCIVFVEGKQKELYFDIVYSLIPNLSRPNMNLIMLTNCH